jgi:hypothetical protein
MYRFISGAFFLLLATVLTAAPVFGQHSHSEASFSLPNTVSESELNVTARLYAKIETIYAVYETKLIRADTKTEKKRFKARREQAVETAIQDAPLSEQRYQTILDRTNQEERLSKRFHNILQEARAQ